MSREVITMSDATGEHTAIVTGANHGIGAAAAEALAGRGCAVLCSFLRVEDPADPGTPQAYREHRMRDAEPVAARIRAGGGRGAAGAGGHPGEQRHRLAGRHVRPGRPRPARPVTAAGERADLAAAVH